MTVMRATMMDAPMGVPLIMRHGRDLHPDSVVGTYDGTRVTNRTFAGVAAEAERLAGALAALGVEPGDRVGTFCWNHASHLAAYLAVPSMGAILHTLNIRLFSEQLVYIVNHADDRVLLVDAALLGHLGDVLPHCDRVAHVVVIGEAANEDVLDETAGPSWHRYGELLDAAGDRFPWPQVDESAAAAVCYTSGTTGNPKGVVYSHKSTFVHSLAARAVDTFAISHHDRILLIPPMFHANSWGLPYTAWMSGADLVLPGPHLQADHLARLIGDERITFTAAVPTIVSDLLRLHESAPVDLGSLRVLVSGGSAVPPSMIDAVREAWGVPVLQGWGMTETSPLCALSLPPRDAGASEETPFRARSGRAVPGVEIRLVDDDGTPVAHDGTSIGELQLRGPWVTGAYHDDPAPDSFTADGWLRTGDVGTIDASGFVQLTDRTKDVIKSGGEWISSVDLEGRLVAHPDIAEAAVIGVPDPRWQERPLGIVVPKAGRQLDPSSLREFLADQVARWWLPDLWAVVDELPKTSVGKIDKKVLRVLHANGELAVQRTSSPAVTPP